MTWLQWLGDCRGLYDDRWLDRCAHLTINLPPPKAVPGELIIKTWNADPEIAEALLDDAVVSDVVVQIWNPDTSKDYEGNLIVIDVLGKRRFLEAAAGEVLKIRLPMIDVAKTFSMFIGSTTHQRLHDRPGPDGRCVSLQLHDIHFNYLSRAQVGADEASA